MKKLQVFVSSTIYDLEKERAKVVEAILDSGHIPVGMELLGGANTITSTIKKMIDASDIFFLLIGGKYGSIYEKENIGFVEWEYRYAMSKNKPICVIVLSNRMLYRKASEQGDMRVFEMDHPDKYEEFVERLHKENWTLEALSIDDIPAKVYSHITKVMNDSSYDLIGWIRADSVEIEWEAVKEEVLSSTYAEILSLYIERYYKDVDMSDFAATMGKNLLTVVRKQGIMNSFHRIIEIYKDSDTTIKVEIMDQFEYRYLDQKHRSFGKKFFATKQQAESYNVEKLLINNADFTDEFKMKISKNDNRGQLRYCVQSEKSIPMGENYPVNIFYKSSYLCPALDFFQAYSLFFPCKNFSIDIHLRDGLEKKFSIVTSTNSIFSNSYAGSFEANEMKNFGVCSLTLPEWAVPGMGYTVTLKKKSEENH